MNVCFYLDLSKHSNVDLSNPLAGNPGIGGTQFMIWQLSYYLNQLNDIEVHILSPNINNLYDNVSASHVDTIFDAIKMSQDIQCDIFIFRAVDDKNVYKLIEELGLKTIAWGHNFPSNSQLKYLNETTSIVKYVCVGNEQYQMLRDHNLFEKSLFIYNGLDFGIYDGTNAISEKANVITYIGSIVPSKGFHILARNWPSIEKKCPGVNLHVIGSGQLYNRNQKLGKYRIAEKKYEKRFMKYLVDKDGEIKSNVNFLGILGGQNKIDAMREAKVGIVNPSSNTETFGIGAIEFQALGIPVVTKAKNGFFDTIIHSETGLLFKTEKQMVNNIISLLNDNQKCEDMGKKGSELVRGNFDIHNIVYEWYQLIDSIINGKKIESKGTLKLRNNYHWLREINGKFKKVFLLSHIPAIIEYKNYFKEIFRGILSKLRQGIKIK